MLELLTTDFVVMALIAGCALALVCGPLGSFIVWRRMSYFGDTLAHSALLGIAIGLLTGADPQISILVSSLLLAFLLTLLDKYPGLSIDNLLGILAHSSLALGVVVLSLADSVRVNLEAYLFGALLTITTYELTWVLSVVTVVGVLILVYWNKLLAITVHAELAQVEGYDVKKLNLLLVILMASTIAIAMKIVGVLLITSLLIIPPATARMVSKTPEKMALNASVVGVFSVIFGVFGAFYADTPVGPTIVVMSAFFFVISRTLLFFPRFKI